MEAVLLDLGELADTRLVGSRALGLEVEGSDIDVIMITEDPGGVRDRVIELYDAVVDRDDSRIIRLLFTLHGFEVDAFILKPGSRMIRDRLGHVEEYRLRPRDIRVIKQLKEWAIDHHVYDSLLGYLGGVHLVDLYFKLPARRRSLHGFLSFYGMMSYPEFQAFTRDWRSKGILSFMNKYTWATITDEMMSPEPLVMTPQWVSHDRIRDSLKYLPSYFGSTRVDAYRVHDEDGVIHIMIEARGSTKPIIDRFIESFSRYGMDVSIDHV